MGIDELIGRGRAHGFVTTDEIGEYIIESVLPSNPDQELPHIEEMVQILNENSIPVYKSLQNDLESMLLYLPDEEEEAPYVEEVFSIATTESSNADREAVVKSIAKKIVDEAIKKNDINTVERLIPKYNLLVNPQNMAPFIFTAIQYGHIEILRLLLKLGADVNIQYKRRSALHVIASNIKEYGENENNKVCAKLLILWGANLDCKNHDSKTPEMIATQITNIAEEVAEVRKLVMDRYSFKEELAANDWLKSTKNDKFANLMLGCGELYKFYKVPQEVANRIRYFSFPASISQHAFPMKRP